MSLELTGLCLPHCLIEPSGWELVQNKVVGQFEISRCQMCYLMAWNQEILSWERLQGKKLRVKAPAHAIVCTNNQSSFEQSQDIACPLDEKNLPVYRLGIECECSCEDCLEILQSFQDTKN